MTPFTEWLQEETLTRTHPVTNTHNPAFTGFRGNANSLPRAVPSFKSETGRPQRGKGRAGVKSIIKV